MNVGESAQRFTQRYKDDKFKFMCPSTIRDAKLRRPDHEAYDPSTCYIPPDWFKKYKISDGQRQWWDFKAKNWDSVLLFKMGTSRSVSACKSKLSASELQDTPALARREMYTFFCCRGVAFKVSVVGAYPIAIAWSYHATAVDLDMQHSRGGHSHVLTLWHLLPTAAMSAFCACLQGNSTNCLRWMHSREWMFLDCSS